MRRTSLLWMLGVLAALLVPAGPALAPVAAYSDIAARELVSPALSAPRSDVLQVFTRGANAALQLQTRDESDRWSGVQSLGGIITSKPASVTMAANRTDVFARGGSGQLVQRYLVDDVWSGWVHLGGVFVGAPTVVSWAPRRLDVFVNTASGQLWHKWFSDGRWSGWEPLGGSLASAPTAVSMVPGRLDVFARGTDAQLHHIFYVPGRWSGWERLGGVLHSEPAALALGDGLLEVFVRGGEGDLRQKSFVRGVGWSVWNRIPGAISSGPGVVRAPDGLITLGARDVGGRYVTRYRLSSGAWSGWTVIDALRSFRRLGAWVDLYDYQLPGATLSRDAALDDLKARGVRTLYLQTSRFTVDFDVAPNAAGWLDAAHARGLHVVGWYLPGYGDMSRDVRRTLAVANLVTAAGNRFDAVGVDIEAHTGWGTTNEVPLATMNARAVEHLRIVRANTSAPLSAITPQPTATDQAGETWYGFPWREVGGLVDLVLPMAYWPVSCRDACVRDYTLTNARYAASWSGRPVHIAGRGYPAADGTQVSDSDVVNFVDGAIAAPVIGGSLYDYASTRTRLSWWPILARLNTL